MKIIQADIILTFYHFRNEHFWTLTWGVLAGSLDVRVRRDANEQTVLAEVRSNCET